LPAKTTSKTKPPLDTPAVVVGLDPTGLGVVRSLVPRCRRVIALESNQAELGCRTALCEVRAVADLSDHEALFRALVGIARDAGCRPVLFLTADAHALWACENTDQLRPHVLFSLPDAATCRTLMFKEKFSDLAREKGYPIPRTVFLKAGGLAAEAKRAGLSFPIIVKPSNRAGSWDQAKLSKAYILETDRQARAFEDRLAGVVDAVVVQEYMGGGDESIRFCLYYADENLAEPVTFCGRKLLQWPPSRGSTAVCEPIDDPALAAYTTRFFQDLGVLGFCSLEVKDVAGSGGREFRIIEPTIGRPDLQSALASENGVNMPLISYLSLIGRADEAAHYARTRTAPRLWINEPYLMNLAVRRQITAALLLKIAASPKGYLLSRRDDPAVMAAYVREKLRGFVSRLGDGDRRGAPTWP